jgi:hypothetical protein
MPVPSSVLKIAAISLAAYALVVLVQRQWPIPVVGEYLPK